MDVLIEFGKILLPAGIVLYAMYLTMKTILEKEVEKRLMDYKIENSKIVLPMRLQAFERMCLFLERMMPGTTWCCGSTNPTFPPNNFALFCLMKSGRSLTTTFRSRFI